MNEYKDLIDALNFKKEKIPRDRRIFINIALIESFLKTGITIKSLVEDLNENGFIIGYDDFKNGLNRARKKLKTQGNKQTGIIKSGNTQQQQVFSYEKNINEENENTQEQLNERPKTIKQLKAEAEADFKKIQSKPQISKSLQKAIDKRENNGKENSGN